MTHGPVTHTTGAGAPGVGDPWRSLLEPGEQVLWQTRAAKGRVNGLGLLIGLVVTVFCTGLFSALGVVFLDAAGHAGLAWVPGPAALLLGLGLTALLARGRPERLVLVTDRRLLQVDRPDTKPKLSASCGHRSLPMLSREHATRSSLVWHTKVIRNDEGPDHYRRSGILRVQEDLFAAEGAVLRALVPDPRPIITPPAGSCTPDQWALLQSALHPGEHVVWVEGGIIRLRFGGATATQDAVNAVTNMRGVTVQQTSRRRLVTSYTPQHAARAYTKPTPEGTHIILCSLPKRDVEPGPELPQGRFNCVQDVRGAMAALAGLSALA